MKNTISSFGAAGGCVEVMIRADGVQVRATSQDDALDFTLDEWRAFVLGVKAGEFDVDALGLDSS